MYYESYLPLVGYHVKKSSAFGQKARLKDLNQAWQQTQDFLTEFTYFQPMWDIKLTVIGENNLQETENLFGKPIEDNDWNLSLNQLPLASEFTLRKRLNSDRYSPFVKLHIFCRFLWKDFAVKNVELPNDPYLDIEWRTHSSNMGLYLSQHRLFIQPTLFFPCSWQDERFVTIMNKIKDKVPFELKQKNFGGTKMPKNWYELLKLNHAEINWFQG